MRGDSSARDKWIVLGEWTTAVCRVKAKEPQSSPPSVLLFC